MLFLLIFLMVQTPPSTAAPQSGRVTTEWILSQMALHDAWQDQNLLEYEVAQHFDAKNDRLKVHASRDVKTTFHSPDTTRYSVIRSDGSRIIQAEVFDKVMDAESDTDSKETRQQSDIKPINYNFSLQGTDTCGERKCYRLSLEPKRKDKYSLQGTVWIDAEDFAIARVLAQPAKKPSFWTRRSEIDQHYKRIDGFWLPDFMDTWSDIVIFGHSTFRIDYTDYTVRGRSSNVAPR